MDRERQLILQDLPFFLNRITRGISGSGLWKFNFRNDASLCYAHSLLHALFSSEFFVRRCYESFLDTLVTGSRATADRIAANRELRLLMHKLADFNEKPRPTAADLFKAIRTAGDARDFKFGDEEDWLFFYNMLIEKVFGEVVPDWLNVTEVITRNGMQCSNPECDTAGAVFDNRPQVLEGKILYIYPDAEDQHMREIAIKPAESAGAHRRDPTEDLRRMFASPPEAPSLDAHECSRCNQKNRLTERGRRTVRLRHVGDVLVCRDNYPYTQWPQRLVVPLQQRDGTNTEQEFVLIALIQHLQSSATGGHFIAYVRKLGGKVAEVTSSWYKVDDLKGENKAGVKKVNFDWDAFERHGLYIAGAVYERVRVGT